MTGQSRIDLGYDTERINWEDVDPYIRFNGDTRLEKVEIEKGIVLAMLGENPVLIKYQDGNVNELTLTIKLNGERKVGYIDKSTGVMIGYNSSNRTFYLYPPESL